MRSPIRFHACAPAATLFATLATLALLATPCPARASEALFLHWNDCTLGSSATSDLAFDCSVDTGSHDLYVAFSLDSALIDVVALRVVIDIQHQSAVLPPWWELAPDGCRYGSLVQSAQFEGGTACQDFWAGAGSFDMPPPFVAGVPGGDPSRARIRFTIGVPSNEARTLNSTTAKYYAARLMLENDGTTSCLGCMEGACMVLNSIEIVRLGRDPVVLTAPGPGQANWVTWQGGGGASCSAVPVRSVTWGQVKSLYR